MKEAYMKLKVIDSKKYQQLIDMSNSLTSQTGKAETPIKPESK